MNSYHRSDSLLFQFILYEYIRTLEEAMVIRSHLNRSLAEKVSLEVFCHQMTESFVKLAGSEQEYMRIFSWIVDSGFLTKLKNYANLLVEQKNGPLFLKLLQDGHEAWSQCLSVLDQIRKKEPNFKSLKTQVTKALAAIMQLTPTIEALLPTYQNDENILYFLLRHKEELDRTHEAGWTKKWFKRLQPKGADTFMIERYQARGFNEMIAEIQERYDAC